MSRKKTRRAQLIQSMLSFFVSNHVLQLADYDHDVLKQFPVYIYVFPHIYPEADAYGSPRGPSFLVYMNCATGLKSVTSCVPTNLLPLNDTC